MPPRFRCAYLYPDNSGQCVFRGCKSEGDFCPAHQMIVVQEKNRTRQRERKKQEYARNGMPDRVLEARKRRRAPKVTIVTGLPKLPPREPPTDPTTPWCSCQSACECGRLKFLDWKEQEWDKRRRERGEKS